METTMNQLRAWYRDNVADDPVGLHLTNPPHFLSAEEVKLNSGVEYEFIADTEDQAELDKLRKGCSHYDWLDFSKDTGTNFEENRVKFAQEHLHADPEKRLITDGGGFFEVRDQDDRWIRLHLKKGDLITLPAGIYHRLYLDDKGYVKMLRLYTETTEWVALNRGPEADQHPVRAQYLNSLHEKVISVQ
ncbi:1,2-dihydroxy-3-keto-5-methylthiopentene dioxygenase-like [Pomacea canaliculata]|uniref:1,2-dihydroxy-3-keto-5-methylthiopentene dioxygenase-like n=1 Tax=Pomacea canaliculata TaxID=400727 RepID=UPI000D73E193|nr:1,2-dihydroxy-3-keto-5-methylthiopentene dioxygenase-like [Pomacea canaliculata]XP_025110184.1 1,2-dihydroxy-3-keto-5-methylthiopentene dioxygenase-like [Pomacea canaliculata]XP_025110185.1 1,2-dihydroxy-3-keto-5-methylthiopentene dioxygenase-like [Pomacea canaliculata]XP_025110186.1 1,2-dihydroxy-3-keto-5-methylthiopentene dioxygenase-like [Pomacea canaliculata]XP_025110187.1 1,2-dihydroxy-3-keto-5-methylthiopentene dioxygenase-like [Pomacea canaliculata]